LARDSAAVGVDFIHIYKMSMRWDRWLSCWSSFVA